MITHSSPARAPVTGVRPAWWRRLGTRLAAIVASPAGAIVLGLASAGGALALAVSPATGRQVDFEVYRMGAAHLWLHLYDVQLEPFHLHFTYPPFAALLFWPLAQLPVHAGQVAWAVINLVALMALSALSVRAARPDWALRRIWAIAVITVFPVLELNPDVLTLDYGQVNFLLVLMILADLTGVLAVRSRALPRGVLLGIAAAIKLTPLIFIPFLFATRQFRAGITALATFLACTLGTFVIAPGSSWFYWSAKVFERAGNLVYISDQNLHSALQRMTGVDPTLVLTLALTLLFGVGGLAVAAWASRASSPMMGILLCAATGLIISPVSWAHHYVWVVPVLAWLVLGQDRPPAGRWWALGVAILFWAAPIWWVANRQDGHGGLLTFLAANAFFLTAVAFLPLAAALVWSRRAWHRCENAGPAARLGGTADDGGAAVPAARSGAGRSCEGRQERALRYADRCWPLL
jgi:alpha-1,2-mannosyltransferase